MELLQALSEWQVAVAIRRSTTLYPLLNAAHILSIGLILGSIATLDLRLLGLFRGYSLSDLAPPLWRMAAFGVLFATLTGALLFSVRPVNYVQNPAFLIKLGLVGLGVLNALVIRASSHWRAALAGEMVHASIRASAALSLAAWIAAVISGRWIGFLQ